MRFKALRFTALLVPLLLLLALTASRPPVSLAQTNSKNIPPANNELGTLTVDVGSNFVAPPSHFLQMGANYTDEVEQNGSIAAANMIAGRSAAIRGYIYPNADEDFFAFTADAGDRVYVATMTSASPTSTNSVIEIQDSLGVVLELDDDDGTFAATASTIAGTTIPTAGTYYIRMRANTTATSIRPYNLYLQLQNGTIAVETESNNTPATANPLPVTGWVSGSQNPADDDDYFSLNLNAGDTVYLSLDLDPERDAVTWNGRLGFGLFGNASTELLFTNDASTTSPNSEAFFLTVKDSGTYYAFVDHATAGSGSPTSTYQLSATVFPAAPQVGTCNTYTSTDTPIAIPTGPGSVTSTIVVPGNPIIADVDLHFDLTHTFMADLDASLASPANNTNGVFTDIGAATVGGPQTAMNLILDDEAALPPTFLLSSPMHNKPEAAYRLSWFDGSNGGGSWVLTLRDDATGDGGTLNSWSITICEPEAEVVMCPADTTLVTVYSSDFEADDGGFTHSGTADEWERGLPALAATTTTDPLAAFQTCNSGTSCWKTDLDGSYNASSNQNLLSPNIDLTGLVAPVVVNWSQRYQMETTAFDRAYVDAKQVGGGSSVRLWEWLDGTMVDNNIGNPFTNVPASSGWSTYSVRADSLAGLNSELLFHLDSDSSVHLGGLAIDDVSVTACAPVPVIELTKTVGTDPSSCAATDTLNLVGGGEVTYCYTVENTGTVTATTHTLVDDQLGTILNNFPYILPPGATTFITQTVIITETTVNVAEWTAGTGLVSGSDMATATVTIEPVMYGVELSADMSASGQPGDVVTYTVSITNVGNISSGFMLTVEDSVWATTLSTDTVVLDVGEVDTFEAYVTIPLTATDGLMDTALVMATSAAGLSGGGVATDTVELTTSAFIAPVYGVELSADMSASGQPGEVVTYTVSITNVGNISSGFVLTVEDSIWSTSLSDSSIVLDVGEVDTFEAYVTIPLTATDGMMDIALVMATSAAGLSGGGVATDTVELTTTAFVVPVYGVELSADMSASGLPGDVVTYTVSITNVGNISSGFMLTVEDSVWATSLSGNSIVLDVGEVDTFEAYVTIPLTATDGMMDTALVMATSAAGLSGGGVATDTVELTTSAVENAVYAVDLSADMAMTGTAGSMVTYTISITNNGNVQDTFDLEVTAVWTTTLSTSSVVLNAGETDEITVVVYIPADAANLDEDMAMVTATSQGDDTESDMTHLTTTAVVETPAGYTLYLPIIDRN